MAHEWCYKYPGGPGREQVPLPAPREELSGGEGAGPLGALGTPTACLGGQAPDPLPCPFLSPGPTFPALVAVPARLAGPRGTVCAPGSEAPQL